MTLTPWREIAVPHDDVLNGTSLQSDFAADLSMVGRGEAKKEYQDAATFYSRTYITEGMALLLKNVMMRLCGKGGEPVIQLKTSFGGGKTHSMIAVYHLAKRTCPLQDLQGISSLLDALELTDIPQAQVAVLDGNALSPGQSWTRGSHRIQTLWGELAWQLGGEEAYTLIAESDINRTSPGKDLLVKLFRQCGPCVILIDELLAFVRQLFTDNTLPAGTFNTNMSFIQAVTEACKIVPDSVLLASLPESDAELGGANGKEVLVALEKYFGRIQIIWKPVESQEAFEIVRRRLFKEITDEKAKNEVCRTFYDMYVSEGNRVPSETQESGYLERLEQAYPIHPQLFDCLYTEWTALEKFQKTRGTLKLLSTVIYALWKNNNQDAFIMPSSIPLADGKVSTELTAVLDGSGWEQVIEKDIDGEDSESAKIDRNDTRLGKLFAAHCVSRSIFMKTAPLPSEITQTTHSASAAKGVPLDYIILGCLQPGQSSSLYADAVRVVSDKLHYLSFSGDGSTAEKRYYRFNTRANLRKEMEDRRNRITNTAEVLNIIREELKRVTNMNTKCLFDAVHCFTPHTDIPDDSKLRLVFLEPNNYYSSNGDLHFAEDAVKTITAQNGAHLRMYQNRLLFVAPDGASVKQVEDTAKTIMAWESILADIDSLRLNTDTLQIKNTKNELITVKQTFTRQIQSCWKYLLVPEQETGAAGIEMEMVPIQHTGNSYMQSIEDVCIEHEAVIRKWAPVHYNNQLTAIYWKNSREPLPAMKIWDDMMRYLYFPRLQNEGVYESVFRACSSVPDYFATAQGKNGDEYIGLQVGKEIFQLDDELLIVPLETAKAQLEKTQVPAAGIGRMQQPIRPEPVSVTDGNGKIKEEEPAAVSPVTSVQEKKYTHLFAEAEIKPLSLPADARQIYDEIISVLNTSPDAKIRVTLTVEADYSNGADQATVRAVKENADSLHFKTKEWS